MGNQVKNSQGLPLLSLKLFWKFKVISKLKKKKLFKNKIKRATILKDRERLEPEI